MHTDDKIYAIPEHSKSEAERVTQEQKYINMEHQMDFDKANKKMGENNEVAGFNAEKKTKPMTDA